MNTLYFHQTKILTALQWNIFFSHFLEFEKLLHPCKKIQEQQLQKNVIKPFTELLFEMNIGAYFLVKMYSHWSKLLTRFNLRF